MGLGSQSAPASGSEGRGKASTSDSHGGQPHFVYTKTHWCLQAVRCFEWSDRTSPNLNCWSMSQALTPGFYVGVGGLNSAPYALNLLRHLPSPSTVLSMGVSVFHKPAGLHNYKAKGLPHLHSLGMKTNRPSVPRNLHRSSAAPAPY